MFTNVKELFARLFDRVFTTSSKVQELTKTVNELEIRMFKLEEIVINQAYVLTTYTKVQEDIVDHVLGTVTKGHPRDKMSASTQGMMILSDDDDDLIN